MPLEIVSRDQSAEGLFQGSVGSVGQLKNLIATFDPEIAILESPCRTLDPAQNLTSCVNGPRPQSPPARPYPSSGLTSKRYSSDRATIRAPRATLLVARLRRIAAAFAHRYMRAIPIFHLPLPCVYRPHLSLRDHHRSTRHPHRSSSPKAVSRRLPPRSRTLIRATGRPAGAIPIFHLPRPCVYHPHLHHPTHQPHQSLSRVPAPGNLHHPTHHRRRSSSRIAESHHRQSEPPPRPPSPPSVASRPSALDPPPAPIVIAEGCIAPELALPALTIATADSCHRPSGGRHPYLPSRIDPTHHRRRSSSRIAESHHRHRSSSPKVVSRLSSRCLPSRSRTLIRATGRPAGAIPIFHVHHPTHHHHDPILALHHPIHHRRRSSSRVPAPGNHDRPTHHPHRSPFRVAVARRQSRHREPSIDHHDRISSPAAIPSRHSRRNSSRSRTLIRATGVAAAAITHRYKRAIAIHHRNRISSPIAPSHGYPHHSPSRAPAPGNNHHRFKRHILGRHHPLNHRPHLLYPTSSSGLPPQSSPNPLSWSSHASPPQLNQPPKAHLHAWDAVFPGLRPHSIWTPLSQST